MFVRTNTFSPVSKRNLKLARERFIKARDNGAKGLELVAATLGMHKKQGSESLRFEILGATYAACPGSFELEEIKRCVVQNSGIAYTVEQIRKEIVSYISPRCFESQPYCPVSVVYEKKTQLVRVFRPEGVKEALDAALAPRGVKAPAEAPAEAPAAPAESKARKPRKAPAAAPAEAPAAPASEAPAAA